MVLEEGLLETDSRSTDEVDAFRLHSVNVDVRVNEVDHLPSQFVVDGVLGEGQHAGVDEGDELRVHDLQVDYLDVAVGIAGVERDQVLDEHRQHGLTVSSHDYAHYDDDDLLVCVALLPVVEVRSEL